MKRILGVLLAGVLLPSGCGQSQPSLTQSAYRLCYPCCAALAPAL